MSLRSFTLVVIGMGAACASKPGPAPIANAPTPQAHTRPKQLDVLLADPGWQERYADARLVEVDAQTFAIDTGTEQLTLTTGPVAAKTFDGYREEAIAAGMHVEQSMPDTIGRDSWEVVASRDGSSIGAARAVGADGAILCRFEIEGTDGWSTPLGLCKYVLGIIVGW